MKYLIIAILLFSCQSKPAIVPPPIVIHDTVPPVNIIHDTLPAQVIIVDNRKTIDSLKTALMVAKYKIERVKYYVRIVDRNASQIKFLKGWINRAVQ
jgi:hypothetical protein